VEPFPLFIEYKVVDVSDTQNPEYVFITALQKQFDEEVFQRLLSPHLQYGFRIIYRLLVHEQDSEDVFQEVLYKVVRGIASFRFSASFRTWFSQICFHEAINFVKKRRGTTVITLEDIEKSPSEDAVDTSVWKKLEKEVLWDTINTLKPQYRFVLLSFYQEGLSIKEISEMMECSENNAKVLLFRARQVLKKEYSHA